jgi:hypothetical protein
MQPENQVIDSTIKWLAALTKTLVSMNHQELLCFRFGRINSESIDGKICFLYNWNKIKCAVGNDISKAILEDLTLDNKVETLLTYSLFPKTNFTVNFRSLILESLMDACLNSFHRRNKHAVINIRSFVDTTSRINSTCFKS